MFAGGCKKKHIRNSLIVYDILLRVKSYIVTYKTSHEDLKERHVEARNHLAAAEAVSAEGFTVVSVDRDDDVSMQVKAQRRFLKRLFFSLLTGILLAGVCVVLVWWRSARHG